MWRLASIVVAQVPAVQKKKKKPNVCYVLYVQYNTIVRLCRKKKKKKRNKSSLKESAWVPNSSRCHGADYILVCV